MNICIPILFLNNITLLLTPTYSGHSESIEFDILYWL